MIFNIVMTEYAVSKRSKQEKICKYKKIGMPVIREDEDYVVFRSRMMEFSTAEELAELSKLVGEIVINGDELEIYNDFRE